MQDNLALKISYQMKDKLQSTVHGPIFLYNNNNPDKE